MYPGKFSELDFLQRCVACEKPFYIIKPGFNVGLDPLIPAHTVHFKIFVF
jgi:hypothetical protein